MYMYLFHPQCRFSPLLFICAKSSPRVPSLSLSLPCLPSFSAATYMHLRVKLLGRWAWRVSPGHVVFSEVVSAVFCVPFIITVGPGQSATEGGVEVEQSPGDDSVIVEGHIQCNDADGETNTWQGRENDVSVVSLFSVRLSLWRCIRFFFFHFYRLWTFPKVRSRKGKLYRPLLLKCYKIVYEAELISPLKIGQICFHMDMAPVLWNCPRANSM